MFSVKNTVLFTLFAANLIDQPAPVVRVQTGLLRGKVNADGTIHEYVGIPYATTRGRFQAPLPAPSWDGVFEAVHEHYHCPQVMDLGFFGTEDCLKINVYVPAFAEKPLPVMFYIHGGAYMMGNGGKLVYGPGLLVRHDVILVTFNYRLGAFGFLCLGIEEAPGNAGLKDQIAALRWVKRNIRAFGGDPDNVTIFGHSAGGGSTSLLLMSETTEGLFNRAIVQSGSALAFWTSKDGLRVASTVAERLGYKTNDPKELYDIFTKTPARDFAMASFGQPILHLERNDLMFAPCVEKELPGIEPVFTDIPYNLITKKAKNVSVIYGSTDREGFFLVAEETNETLKTYNNNIYMFGDFYFPTKAEAENVTNKVKEFYFGHREVNGETKENLSDLYGDLFFDMPVILETDLMLRKIDAPIYNYYFKYSGGRNLVKSMYAKNKNEPGASHGDDLQYIFDGLAIPFRIKERDRKIVDWLTKMWTNYAKYGHPTPQSDKESPIKWEPSTKKELKFLYIDDKLEMGPTPNRKRVELWRELYKRYRKIK